MKIITRGEGIRKYTIKKGEMSAEDTEGKLWLKLDIFPSTQYIVELEKREIAKIVRIGLKNKEVAEIYKRMEGGINV